MYISKYTVHQNILRAFANPKRVDIIQVLQNRELGVSTIQKILNLPESNLSQHLKVLRTTNVVKTRRNGKQIFYRVSNKNFIKLSNLLREILPQN